MNTEQNVKMTYSSIIIMEGKPAVAVTFERGQDLAEGTIPSGRIRRNKGFSDEEVQQLSAYLIHNQEEIMREAKKISSLKHLFSEKKNERDGESFGTTV